MQFVYISKNLQYAFMLKTAIKNKPLCLNGGVSSASFKRLF